MLPTRATVTFLLFTATIITNDLNGQSTLVRVRGSSRSSVSHLPPGGSSFVCDQSNTIATGTVILPYATHQALAVSSNSSATFTVEGLPNGFKTTALVSAGPASGGRTEDSRVSDSSLPPCGSGFPAQIEIVPENCAFDLIVDALNTGGASGANYRTSVQVHEADLMSGRRTLVFVWDSGNSGQQGQAPTFRRSFAPLGTNAVLLFSCFANAATNSIQSQRYVEATVRVIPRSQCSELILAGGCTPRLTRRVHCDGRIELSAVSQAHANGRALLFLGLPSTPVPLGACMMHPSLSPLFLLSDTAIDASGVARIATFNVPSGLGFDGVVQAAMLTTPNDLSLTEGIRLVCP